MLDFLGQQLGNYRLTRLLGKGGFAQVYLGEHVYLKTPAAIKLLQTKVANQEDLQAFLQEAQTIAQLVHPHIVRVMDFGVEGETPFLVMDYAAGGTLRQRHAKGTQVALPTIVSYVKQVAEALQYAHEEKFIHRDVKPENMLLGRRDGVLLSDFGIALIAQSSRYQSTQDVIGTVAYMAPEQIQGKPRPASDQYSLGIVVYEWLSGDRPFHGSFTELCTQHMFAPPAPLHEKVPAASVAVEEVVMTVLAKDPKGRFGSVQAFAYALEQASQDSARRVVSPRQPQQLGPSITLPSQATLSPTESATPESQVFLPTRSDLPIKPFAVPSETISSLKRPKQGLSRVRVSLLVGLVLTILVGSIGVFTAVRSNQINNANIAAATDVQDNATATAFAPTVSAATTASQNPYPPHLGTLALNDPLRDNTKGYGWYENAKCVFKGGAYHVIGPATGYLTICAATSTNYSNFTFQVQMTIIQGSVGGIILRLNPTGYYYFRLGRDGSYVFYSYVNGVSRTTSGSTSFFHSDLNQTNLIAVVARRNELDLYINLQYITSVNDSNLTQGEVAVVADNVIDATEVVFSNARVWTL